MNKIKKGLKEVREGKILPYKSFKEWEKERDTWVRNHPILYRLKQTYYSIRRFFIRIGDFFLYDIKYFIQRGKRGYAIRDVWGFDYYLAKVISGGIDDLIKEVYGHPCGLKNMRQWKSILKKISKTFKTTKKISDNELVYLSAKKYNNIQRKKAVKSMKDLDKKCPLTHHKIMTLKQTREYEEGWQLFQEYFFNLWD